jgi:hypothetical protein
VARAPRKTLDHDVYRKIIDQYLHRVASDLRGYAGR